MPIILAIAIVALLVLVVTRFGWGRPAKRCRWKKDEFGRRGELNRFVCLECNVDCFLKSDKPPVECKRQFRSTRL